MENKTLHYPYNHTTLVVNRDFPHTLIHEITYTFNNLIEFKPNFYNIKKFNKNNNNMIKPFLESYA